MRLVRSFLVLSCVLFFVGCSMPSNARLSEEFAAHRDQYAALVNMSNQDPDFVRISPTSLMSKDFTNYPDQEGNSGLPAGRWNSYQQLFREGLLKLGLERYASGDVYLINGRTGKFGHYITWGYLHCTGPHGIETAPAPPPCRSQRETGAEPAATGSPAIYFQRLDQQWYLFKQGIDH